MPCNNRNILTLDWSAHHLLLFSVYQTEIPCSDFYEIRLLKTWINAIKISPRRKIINYSLTHCRPQFDARVTALEHSLVFVFFCCLPYMVSDVPVLPRRRRCFALMPGSRFFWSFEDHLHSQADSISIIITLVIIITNRARHHCYWHLLSTLLSLPPPPPPHGSYNFKETRKDFSRTVFKV